MTPGAVILAFIVVVYGPLLFAVWRWPIAARNKINKGARRGEYSRRAFDRVPARSALFKGPATEKRAARSRSLAVPSPAVVSRWVH